MKNLILMDFDGTITSKDTLFEVAKFSLPRPAYWIKIAFLMPVFGIGFFKIISKQKLKEIFLKCFFNLWSTQRFNTHCLNFCKQRLPDIIRPKAMKAIQNFSQKDDIYIVSASPENWIIPWANRLNIGVIASQLETVNNQISGNLKGKNVNGLEKVHRIKKNIDLTKYNKIIAFGDTKGDLPMLNMADEQHFKPFL